MSSRTISTYRIEDPAVVERRRVQSALNKWSLLRGRAAALAQRCESAGHPECAIGVGQPTATDSAGIEQECGALEIRIAEAASRLEKAQLDDQARVTNIALGELLADLERREFDSSERTASPTEVPAETGGLRFADRIAEKLATLRADSAELEAQLRESAGKVLLERDPARASLLYDDLSRRIADANRQAAIRSAYLSEIAELRAQLTDLPSPGAALSLIGTAEAALERGDDPAIPLRQARDAVARELDVVSTRSDIEFVREAVSDFFVEGGYEVLDIGLETPETLVFRQSPGYGVRAEIKDGHIDLRTVRLDTGTGTGVSNKDSDRDADDQLCQRLKEFTGGMSGRGVTVTVGETQLPGSVEPPTVRVAHRPEKSARAKKRRAKAAAREMGAD